jgi:hypothetical protein
LIIIIFIIIIIIIYKKYFYYINNNYAGFVTTDELTGPVAAAFTSHMEDTTMPGMVASSQLSAKIDRINTPPIYTLLNT